MDNVVNKLMTSLRYQVSLDESGVFSEIFYSVLYLYIEL